MSREPDRITANLPARDFAETSSFYAKLGFEEAFRDEGWMILTRGPLELEFYHQPDIDPYSSATSACVRVADGDALHRDWAKAGLPDAGIPRLTPPEDREFGLRMFALVDCNGNLLRGLSPLKA